MTCFWDGIISSLNMEDFKLLDCVKKPTREQLIACLKKLNTEHKIRTKWQGQTLSDQEKQEHSDVHIV